MRFSKHAVAGATLVGLSITALALATLVGFAPVRALADAVAAPQSATVGHAAGTQAPRDTFSVTSNVPGEGLVPSDSAAQEAALAGATFTVSSTTSRLFGSTPLRLRVPTDDPTDPISGMNPGPGAASTGVPAGTRLTVVQGDLRIKQAGTVLDSLDIHGVVYVDAPNVTISNTIIRGSDSGSSGALITATGGYANLVISDSELAATVASPYINGIIGSNFSATNVNIHGVIDAVHLTAGNVVVKDSWLHDNLHYTVDPTQKNTPSHDDSVQIQKGSNIQIIDNLISGAHNSGIQITQNMGNVSNLVFRGNKIDGGGCSFNISEGGKGSVVGVSISDNIFGRTTKVANCAIIAPTTSMPAISDNYYVDGAAVTVHRG